MVIFSGPGQDVGAVFSGQWSIGHVCERKYSYIIAYCTVCNNSRPKWSPKMAKNKLLKWLEEIPFRQSLTSVDQNFQKRKLSCESLQEICLLFANFAEDSVVLFLRDPPMKNLSSYHWHICTLKKKRSTVYVVFVLPVEEPGEQCTVVFA